MEIKIKYVDSLYVVNKGSKFNIYMVAATGDSKTQKIGSSMYATHDDIEALHDAYTLAKERNNTRLECELSTGPCNLHRYIPPLEQQVILYNVTIGGISSVMSETSYNDFVKSIENCYTILTERPNILSFIKGKRKIKKEKKGLFD